MAEAGAVPDVPIDGRYRTLLEISSVIAQKPNLQAILDSLYSLLSAVVRFESVVIVLLSEDEQSIRVTAVRTGSPGKHVEVGTTLPCAGTAVERALRDRSPVYMPDVPAEISKAGGARSIVDFAVHSGYVFPLSTPRRALGGLFVGSVRQGEFSADDIALIESVASHVATAIESAIATDSADSYQKQLRWQRDRLRLLLEINNHIISRLTVNDLLHAACTSFRKHFVNDFAGVWILDKEQKCLECTVLDFPGSNGSVAEMVMPELTASEIERIRTRQADLLSRVDMEKLPPALLAKFTEEGIQKLAISPLSTANGPLGVIVLGSRRANHFTAEDLDLLGQVGTQIALALDNALAYARLNASHNRLEEERLYLESEIRSEYNFEDIIGKSEALRRVLEQIAVVAPTGSTVLLHGETGTGKELVARALHSLSPRKDRTFVRLNCAAIPSGLIESELFGHEKGAFTGALMQKRGRFELADRGTLFLDEIGDISLDLQPKLLRALQEHEFERLGSTKTIQVDVRLIAATHRDLATMIREGKFREDLFYRLNVFPIEVPPLRDRREDIPLLVHYFVSRLARRMQKRISSIPKRSMEKLASAPWPGNIRELENFIERCVILTPGDQLVVPVEELTRPVPTPHLVSTFHDAERQAIIDALKSCSGKISGLNGAAERLGLKRTTLQNKMRKLNISRADYAQ